MAVKLTVIRGEQDTGIVSLAAVFQRTENITNQVINEATQPKVGSAGYLFLFQTEMVVVAVIAAEGI